MQGQGVATGGGHDGAGRSASALAAALALPRRRPELLGLLAVLVVALAIGHGLSAGFVGLGVVGGAAVALQALGLVLVHRSSGLINFAQVQLGATSAVLFSELVQRHELLHFAAFVCGPCLPGGADHPAAVPQAVEFWLALLIAVALSALLGWLSYAMLMRRFARAPRLVATVLTIGIAQLLAGIAAALPSMFDPTTQGVQLSNAVPIPLHVAITVAPTTFTATDVCTVAAVLLACAGLAWFLLRSRRGVAVRGAADNAQRARTLGVDVDSLGGTVWLIAGVLSGVAACLQATAQGISTGSALDVTTLVGILAAAVIGGFRSLPMVVAGAVVLGILDQGIRAGINAPDVYSASLLVVISLFLLLQRGVRSRAESEAAVGWLAAREVRPIPEALRRLPVVQTWLRWGMALLAVLVVAYPVVMSPNDVATATRIAIYAMLGVSLLVLTGWGGQISLGQLAIAAVGAYVAALVSAGTGVSFVAGVVAAAGCGAVAALLVGVPALRLRGLNNLAVSTLAMALTVSLVVISANYLGASLPAVVQRPVLLGLDLEDPRVFYYLCLLLLAAVLAATAMLRRSRTARALIASRENEPAARALGVSPARVRLLAFAVSGALAGIAGALLAYNEHGVHAPDLTPELGVSVFLMVVIGGMGSLWGPVLGAVYMGFLLSTSSQLVGFLAGGGGVVFVLLVAPGGLVQLLAATRDAMLRRVAMRHRIHAPGLVAQRAVEGTAPAPITPLRAGGGGGRAYVPVRYRLDVESPPVGGGGGGG